ncbi:c-type cytochrome [Psychrobacter sp. FDAARGOS_221]|uniref:c-type cytochrome n=1 Tax=Psychrobacter sp. FDAARGOS_221 TaxID=1975705 RepID=UPI000BB55E9F|nr:cytochrome c [Psychrobacter sp. FDAARGOS_221]PNK60350.1 cytochrome C [Psychrobacter sp. FDAARGOS_221]
MQLKPLLLATLLPISLTLAACSSGGQSEQVSARQDDMKNWKDAKDQVENLLKDTENFDLAAVQKETAFLAENSESPWSNFSDSQDMGGASEAVWGDPEGFKSAIANYQQAATELNMVAQNATSADEIMPAFNALGDGCKSCHENFKAPKD